MAVTTWPLSTVPPTPADSASTPRSPAVATAHSYRFRPGMLGRAVEQDLAHDIQLVGCPELAIGRR